MPLFVVRHQHSAERCPAGDPDMGAMLLNHLSRPNVKQHGVEIQGEAVVDGEHTLYLIVQATDEVRLRSFMQPFELVGSLDIYPASTCARVVASGGCDAATPISTETSALDPEDGCQQAIEAGLVVHRAHPLNCETSINPYQGWSGRCSCHPLLDRLDRDLIDPIDFGKLDPHALANRCRQVLPDVIRLDR